MKLPNFVSPSSDRSSKIGHDFGNKVVQKLTLSINIFYKKRAPKQLFFNEKKNQKDSDDFWHRKLTLKVKFCHYLTPCHYSNSQNLVISFEYSWFLVKNLSNFLSLPWKLHNRYCHNMNAPPKIFSTHYATDCCNNMALQWWKGRSDFVSSLWYVVARAKIRSCCQQLDSTLQTYSYALLVTNPHTVKSSQV